MVVVLVVVVVVGGGSGCGNCTNPGGNVSWPGPCAYASRYLMRAFVSSFGMSFGARAWSTLVSGYTLGSDMVPGLT